MQSIRSSRNLSFSVAAHRASVAARHGCFRFNSVCASVMVQKLAVPRLQQSVPLLAAFRVASRHFSLTNDASFSDLPVFDINSKLFLKNGQPFTGCGQANFPNAAIYSGDVVDGKRHGHGVLKYANGDIYEGEWKDNLKDGVGIITDADGKIISQGLFKRGKMFTGGGLTITNHGSIYEGEMLEGERIGQGKLTSKSGKVWEGEFRHGEPFNGKGCYNSKQGVWVEGVFTADNKKKTSNSGNTNASRYSGSNVVGSVKKERKRAVKLEKEESDWDLP